VTGSSSLHKLQSLPKTQREPRLLPRDAGDGRNTAAGTKIVPCSSFAAALLEPKQGKRISKMTSIAAMPRCGDHAGVSVDINSFSYILRLQLLATQSRPELAGQTLVHSSRHVNSIEPPLALRHRLRTPLRPVSGEEGANPSDAGFSVGFWNLLLHQTVSACRVGERPLFGRDYGQRLRRDAVRPKGWIEAPHAVFPRPRELPLADSAPNLIGRTPGSDISLPAFASFIAPEPL